jgi:hypothetical protein
VGYAAPFDYGPSAGQTQSLYCAAKGSGVFFRQPWLGLGKLVAEKDSRPPAVLDGLFSEKNRKFWIFRPGGDCKWRELR